MGKNRILWFSNSEIRGNEISGTGNWVLALLEHIRFDDRYELHIAFHDKHVQKLDTSIADGVQIHHIPLNRSHSKVGLIIDSWLRRDPYKDAGVYYDKIIQKINPDLIQIFGLESPYIRILERYSSAVVIHIQGLLAPYQYKYYPRFSSLELILASSLKSWLRLSPEMKRSKESEKHLKLESALYEKIQYVLGRTDWDRRCIKAMAPQAKYLYCQEIMRQAFYQKNWIPSLTGTVVLYTTIRDNRVKNVDMIFETAHLLDRWNSGFHYEWRVAGVSQSDLTPRIMKHRRTFSCNIKLLGSLSSEDLIDEMMNSDLFVYPSAIENGCNAVQEAMLLGMPILCTYAGGMSTTINHGYTGILIPEGDPYVMAGAILEMFEDYDNAVIMGQNALRIAREVHSPTTVVEQLTSAYRLIIKENHER